MGKGDESENEVDFKVAKGVSGEKEEMVVEAVSTSGGVKVNMEKLDCLGVESEERARGQDSKGKMGGIDGQVKVVEEKLVTFLMMMV